MFATTFLIGAERSGDALDDAIGDDDDVAIAAITVAELWVGVWLATGESWSARLAFLDDVLEVIPVLDYDRTVADAHATWRTRPSRRRDCEGGRPDCRERRRIRLLRPPRGSGSNPSLSALSQQPTGRTGTACRLLPSVSDTTLDPSIPSARGSRQPRSRVVTHGQV